MLLLSLMLHTPRAEHFLWAKGRDAVKAEGLGVGGGTKQKKSRILLVKTHFEVQGPEFCSINNFTDVLVSLIKDQRFLPEETVG